MVAFWFQHDQVTPVDAANPADQVDGGEELAEANYELCLIQIGVAEACDKHRACSWKENVEYQA